MDSQKHSGSCRVRGTRSYSAIIVHVLTRQVILIFKVKPPWAKDLADVGKAHEIEVKAAAVSALYEDLDRLL